MTTTERAPAGAGADAWRLNVLGPVELCYDGRPVEVAGATRTLLALLARTPGQEVDTATIVAGIWGSQPPEDAEKEVASHVSRLRKALTVVAPDASPTSVVVTLAHGYILDIEPSNADILAFERFVADGRRALTVGAAELAAAHLERAIALWRGPAYADFGDHAFVRTEAARLDDLRLTAIESRVDALLAIAAPSAPAELVEELAALTAEHWQRETLWGQYATVLYRLGRRDDALAVYRHAYDRLAKGLRTDPGPALRAVERAIRADDPALLGTHRPPATVPEALAGTVPACVGRDEEIGWLLGSLDLAATRRAQGRLIVGSPGTGKTRLVAEVAQRAARSGVAVRYWRPDGADGGASGHWSGEGFGGADQVSPGGLGVPEDRLTLLVVDDLDLAPYEDVVRLTSFFEGARMSPMAMLVTCSDPVRVGDLAGLPKLTLSTLDEHGIAEIVRIYAPGVSPGAAVAAMVNTGGLPARVHRAASEWAFARAGRRIDRAVADVAEPVRRLDFARAEVMGGVADLAHVRAQARRLAPHSIVEVAGPPYPGLAAFEREDAELFHGRERLVADLVARLMRSSLVAVIGGVASGKSSLVRAGLVPALAAGVLPDSATWRPVVVTPTTSGSLAEQLAPPPLEPAEPAPDVEPDPPADDTVEVVEAPGRVLLVVDQFEEAFTVLDPHTRAGLIATIVAAARTDRVVLALRADHYPRCAEHAGLADLVTANTLLVGPMTGDELRRAIEQPAQAAGLSFADGLVDTIVADAQAAPDDLAHLGLALRTLWDNRVVEDGARRSRGDSLVRAGYPGVAGTVAAFAERAFAALGPDGEREAGRTVLMRLSRLEDGSLLRRRATRTELAGLAPAAAVATAKLVDAGLLTLDGDRVVIAHDVIAQRWPRLRRWWDEAAVEVSLRRHLTDAAGAWNAAGRRGGPLYQGARLAAALDLARERPTELTTVEHDFLGASQRVVLAADIRRRRRNVLLWKWLAATIAVALLAVAVAVVAVTMQVRASAAAELRDAQAAATRALTEPDPQLALLLAVAAARVDPDSVGAVRSVLQRWPDLVALGGTDVTALTVSRDGRTLLAGTGTGAVTVLDANTLRGMSTLDGGLGGAVSGLATSADGRHLVAWGGVRVPGQNGHSVAVWDLTTGRPLGTAFGQAWPGPGGGLLADGDTLLLAQHGPDDRTSAVAWSLDARTPSTAYELPAGAISSLQVSADGRFAVLATAAGTTVLEPATATSHPLPARQPLALSPDGRTLVVADGPRAESWSVGTARRLATGAHHTGDVRAAAFAPDGATVATVGADGLAVLWNPATMTTTTIVTTGPDPALVAFTPDGRTLITGRGTLATWDLTGTRGAAIRLASSPDPAALACAIAGRPLTESEWTQALPHTPYLAPCP